MAKELVFIPLPLMGHLLPTVEFAHRLVSQHPSDKITATIFSIKFPNTDEKIKTYIKSLKSSSKTNPVSIIELPDLISPPDPNSNDFRSLYLDAYKPVIKQALLHHQGDTAAATIVGLVLDMFCTNLIDVGDDLGIPSYIFFTVGASTLSFLIHFNDDVIAGLGGEGRSLADSTVAEVAGFENPIPVKVWPTRFLSKDGSISRSGFALSHARNFHRVKGFIVNTFTELQPSIIDSLSTGVRGGAIYPVGPILNLKEDDRSSSDEVTRWLDSHPPSSVVFLCFGSSGTFEAEQVKEIAVGLERSGHRFLWSLRSPSSCGGSSLVWDDFNEVLPEGFVDRTAEFGKVIGWAPQVAVLAHESVGAFVSHCGWNSTLESLWFGVPILAWPMYAEQQLNAFLLVVELGLAVEVQIDYKRNPREGGSNMIVKAEVIEKAVRRMMEEEEGQKVRQKVKEMSLKARTAVSRAAGGSSWESMGRFVKDVLENQTMQ